MATIQRDLTQLIPLKAGSEERLKVLKSILWGAGANTLASIYVFGNYADALLGSGEAFNQEENALVLDKSKKMKHFKRWVEVYLTIEKFRKRIGLYYESAHKINNFLQATCALWTSYDNVARALNYTLHYLESNEQTRNTPASEILRQTVLEEFNEGVCSILDKPVVSFLIDEEDTFLGSTRIVKLDATGAKETLSRGYLPLNNTLSRIKTFEDALLYIDQKASEEGCAIQKSFKVAINEYLANIKRDLAYNGNYSSRNYAKLLAEGRTEEAEEIKEGFMFPDYNTVERDEMLYQHYKHAIDALWT